MVARTPPKLRKKLMVAPLDPTLIRETVKKVDRCMARLQELQYTVTGGNKAVGGVNLSPRSTRGYLKASLRCKQESIRLKGAKRSPTGKLQSTATGDWRRTSLPAMLLGETVGEILHAGKFAKDFVQTISLHSDHTSPPSDDPKTPVTLNRKQRPSDPDTAAAGGIESRRKREKKRVIRMESNTPVLQRARSRINFKVPSPKRGESDSNSIRFSANRVSPRHRPWAKKAVLFPNPLFNSLPTSHRQRFCRTEEPDHQIGATTPHKFMIKSPPAKSKFQVRIRSPVAVAKISPPRVAVNGSNRRASPMKMAVTATAAKLRRSLSPARLASRLMSPLKSRNNSIFLGGGGGGPGGGAVVSGLKQRQSVVAMARKC